MAVPEQTPYSEHTGNGVTKSFALNFDCESKDHLIVLVDEIEPPIATWSLSAGNVVFNTAPVSGQKIIIQRNTPFSRTVDYQSYNNSFRPPAVNKDFDWIWLKLQELGVADWILSNRIDALKNYVDDRDDELRAYLMEEIRKQGVALDQLDDYYNYLMQRLAQIAVDKGWDASFVVDGSQTQKEINLYGGKKYDMPVGGYQIGQVVILDNGDVVQSIIADNKNNPNINPEGWLNISRSRRAFPSVLDNPLVRGDGETDDSVALQRYFRSADDNRKSSIFFPLRDFRYLIQSPLVVQEPLMIYGDAGATYNRGIGKDGHIIIGASAAYAFNLGNERTYSATEQNVDTKKSRNGADNWTLKNLSFIQEVGVAARTKIAVKHTAANDGPDRGFIMREVSGTGLKHVLHVTNQNKSTQLANVIIENSCISNCELPVFAEGMVLGLRFVGNQCEQNTLGAIKGTFNGAITIEDNMLEGQQNPFELVIPAITGNRPKISYKRNYLEANAGDFILKLITTSPDAELELAQNYLWTATTKDFVQIDGRLGAWNITNRESRSIAFLSSTIVSRSSDMFSNIKYYKQYMDTTTWGASVYTANFSGLARRSSAASFNIAKTNPVEQHPLYGGLHYIDSAAYMPITQATAANDIIVVNLLCSAQAKNDYILQCFNNDYSAVIAEVSLDLAGRTQGALTLLTIAFKVTGATSVLRFRLYSPTQTTGDRKVFGLSVENLGQHVANTSKNIYPALPDLSRQVLFTPAVNQADSVATDVAGLKTDFNALLAKLKNSGQMQ